MLAAFLLGFIISLVVIALVFISLLSYSEDNAKKHNKDRNNYNSERKFSPYSTYDFCPKCNGYDIHWYFGQPFEVKRVKYRRGQIQRVIVELINRECRYCEHVWPTEIRTSLHVYGNDYGKVFGL